MYAQAIASAPRTVDFANLALCRGLGRQAASNVVAVSTLVRFVAGKTVFAEGDEAAGVYEVVRGTLKLYKLLSDGRRQITGFLSAGHLLGLAYGEHYLYTAEAVTEVTLCRYARARFDRLIEEVPGLARILLAATSDELRAAQDQMLLLGRKDAMEKIASFLLMMAERHSPQGDGDEILVPMGRSDIADYLGLTTETVSRTLTRLKREGTIELPTAVRITLSDRDRLEELAAGETDERL